MALTIDITDGGSLSSELDPATNMRVWTGTRVAAVTGLTDTSADLSSTALARSLAAAGLPQIGDPWPPGSSGYPTEVNLAGVGSCVCVGHYTLGHRESDDATLIRISYKTITRAPPSGGVPFTVSDDTRLIGTKRNYHPGEGKQLWVQWTDPADANNTTPKIPVSMTTQRVVRKVVLSAWKLAGDTNVTAGRENIGTVNDATWMGLPAGYWRFSDFHDVTLDRGVSYQIVAELDTKVDEDWGEYEFCINPNTGRYMPVTDADMAALIASYTYGIQRRNGVIKVGWFDTADFASVFGLGG